MIGSEQRLRRETIRQLIRAQAVETQEHLGALLKKAGFKVTQATLSRDLAKLGARRASSPEGGTSYELGEPPTDPQNDGFASLRELVHSVEATDALVVIRTTPGAASAVALGLDQRKGPGLLATLAGDDTIFVATSRGTRPIKLAKQLRRALEKEQLT